MAFLLGALVALPLVLQVGQLPAQRRATVVRDSTPADSIPRRRTPKRAAVTAELQRTAFADERARDLLLRARVARLALDSSLHSYEANVRTRLTARLAVGAHGPERVMYRQESASHVQWQENIGATVQMTGARIGIPIAPKSAEHEALESDLGNADLSPVPYFPGQESTWLGGTARADVDDQSVVNPIANGSEAYYTYATGDSMSWTLPGGRAVRLRELIVRPRSPKWNLAVGSLWFDAGSGQLVRAAYRLATPMDMFARMAERTRERAATGGGSPPSPVGARIVKALISPMQVQVDAIAIEYGLFEGRYWLPRTRSMEGSQRVSFARVPVELEQAFSYTTINGPLALAPIALNAPDAQRPDAPDSLTGPALRAWRDSANAAYRKARQTFQDSLRTTPCDASGQRLVARRRNDIAVAVRYPCDVEKLVTSPEFTTPLYAPNDALFNAEQRDALIADALPFGAQALLSLSALPRPEFQYGLSMTRYNRIEGFSTGIHMQQQFGAGYVGSATGRFGFADREPNVELTLARTNLARTISLTGYNRLVSANDWGNPLSFGSSLSAFLFGRDEGFYYRASGAELRWTTDRGTLLDWRLFGEQERTARQHADFSVGGSFIPNIVSARGVYTGASVRWQHEAGLDPRGVRAFTDLRLEAATGDSSYGRAALDVTLSTGLPHEFAGALTLAGGTSVGQLPSQRRWFLGGAQTIRGERPDTAQSGNAFWLSRVELGPDRGAYRLTAFGDLGWAGDRADLVRPMSDVGVGLSMLDGLVRFDVARGFYPRKETRFSAYLQSRF